MKRYRLASWIMGLALILTLGAVPVLAAEENGGISPGDVISGEAASKVPVTGISLRPTSLTLNVCSSAVLTAHLQPVNASERQRYGHSCRGRADGDNGLRCKKRLHSVLCCGGEAVWLICGHLPPSGEKDRGRHHHSISVRTHRGEHCDHFRSSHCGV